MAEHTRAAANRGKTPREVAEEEAQSSTVPTVSSGDLPKGVDGPPIEVEKPVDAPATPPAFEQPRVNAPEGSIAELGHAREAGMLGVAVDDMPEPMVETVAERYPAPGMTERGWSPEVTARHPEVLAANIEAILEERGGPVGRRRGSHRVEGVDPHDAEALSGALREIGFHDQRKIDLTNEAIRRGSDQLAALDAHAATSGSHGAMAAEELLEEIRGNTMLPSTQH